MSFNLILLNLRTEYSYPPYNHNKNKYKLVKQISEIQINAEIDLYLLARKKCFDLIDFIYNNISMNICNIEQNLLNKIKWRLPSQYDLLSIFWYRKISVYINLQYTSFSQTSSNQKCRTAILVNFREVIALLHKIKSHITNTLKSIKYKEIYDDLLLAFELWLEVAQKKISMSVSITALAKREVFGKFYIL
jgi:hypothetical protein